MKKKYEIRWANVAEKDLANIIEYIAKDSPSNALKILKKIKEKTSSLYHSPKRGRIIPELQEQGIFQYRRSLSIELCHKYILQHPQRMNNHKLEL